MKSQEIAAIRHGIAEDQPPAGGRDADRALTDRGRRRMALAARGLASLLPDVGAILTSPYRRACETADILASEYSHVTPITLDALTPTASPTSLFDALRPCADGVPLVIVGHQPALGHWVSNAIAGSGQSFLSIGKGGGALLRFDAELRPGAAGLRWFLSAELLRTLGNPGK